MGTERRRRQLLPVLAIALSGKPAIEKHDSTRLFLVLSLVAVIGAAAALTALGGTERLGRHERALAREAVVRADRMDRQLASIATAIDEIARHLPEDQNLQNWRGYAAAERAHEAQRTGTDGSRRRRPPHIGLVPPDSGGH